MDKAEKNYTNHFDKKKSLLPFHLILIGFMGSGKSTVAACLSRRYGWKSVEMDEQIEQRARMQISEIFERYGEEYFRNLETELLTELTAENNMIISCGGGTPMRACNVDLMHKNGKVVLLKAEPATVLERVKDSHHRPLIEKNKNAEFLAKLMEERREAYEQAADLIIATDGKTAEEICQELLERIWGDEG